MQRSFAPCGRGVLCHLCAPSLFSSVFRQRFMVSRLQGGPSDTLPGEAHSGTPARMIDVLACPLPLLRAGVTHRHQTRPSGRRVPKHVSFATGASMALEAIAME